MTDSDRLSRAYVDDGPTRGRSLPGGNTNRVLKVGNTVRRMANVADNVDLVNALLVHLEDSGFTESPRFLGWDGLGRQVLTFIEGDVGNYPLEPELTTDAALIESARLLRRFHDVSDRFSDGTGRAGQLLIHGDFAPYNLVFSGTTPVGIIDFDNARPGCRYEDFAYFIYRFAPLHDNRHRRALGWPDAIDLSRRIEAALEAYGTLEDSEKIADWIGSWLSNEIDRIETGITNDDPAFRTHREGDHIGLYREDLDWLSQHRSTLRATFGQSGW